MMDLEVRPARPADRAAVLAFVAGTWDDGDYIADVWDEWLAEATGVLLVGALEGRPVAIAHVRMVSADEGWLEGVRVDPRQRRRGIGRVMTSRALVAARERGAAVVRLFTDSGNTASQELFAGFGFTQVATFARYEAPVQPMPPGAVPAGYVLHSPGVGDLDRLWAFLEASNLAPLNGGLLLQDWWARALTADLLEQRLAAGEVRTLDAWDSVQALAIVQPRVQGQWGTSLAVQYLDGAAEGLSRMALALRGDALAMGLARVTVGIPDLLILHDAMDGAGFERRGSPEHALWCYARVL
jgi:ribosomal protein S18 acetylase RimI-like enzyme